MYRSFWKVTSKRDQGMKTANHKAPDPAVTTMYETAKNDIALETRRELIVFMNQRLAEAIDPAIADEAGALECERPEFHRIA